jgi:Protein of unknown function (DUF2827)
MRCFFLPTLLRMNAIHQDTSLRANGRKLKVGISILVKPDATQSIWENGGNQNCVFLYLALQRSPLVERVWLVHRDDMNPHATALGLGQFAADIAPVGAVLNELDVIIEMGEWVGSDVAAHLRSRGGKLITYRYGNEYIVAAESALFDKFQWAPNVSGNVADEVWTTPQHAAMCSSFFEAMYGAPVRVVPHIWSPVFLEQQLAALNIRPQFGYSKGRAKKRIAIAEPNINIIKTALIPMLICEEAYHLRPDLIEHVYITNTQVIARHAGFMQFANKLNIVKDKIATLEARYAIGEFMTHNADIMVVHQWENALNYLYWDVLYGGYPLVHNSPSIRDAGYYYEGFDVKAGAQALIRAMTSHDASFDAYCESCSGIVNQVHAVSPANVSAYSQALSSVMKL